MPTPVHAVALAAALILVGGCCRDTLREMASIKDIVPQAAHAQKPAQPRAKPERAARSAEVESDGEAEIETGSIPKQDTCQGAHIAYQATRAYLKNFGPRPPDQPGEKGPCLPDAQ